MTFYLIILKNLTKNVMRTQKILKKKINYSVFA